MVRAILNAENPAAKVWALCYCCIDCCCIAFDDDGNLGHYAQPMPAFLYFFCAAVTMIAF